jgi:hypothetical protein
MTKPTLNSLPPELVVEMVNPSLAVELTTGSGRKIDWVCSRGHVYDMRVRWRMRGSGCPYCCGQRVLRGFNSLADTHPQIAAELVDPEVAGQVTSGSHRQVEWRCDLGHQWTATVGNRTRSKRQGCPYCSNNKVLLGFNSLLDTNPTMAADLVYPWQAGHVMASSRTKLDWKCRAGHIYTAAVADRKKGSGCPTCAPSGIRLSMPVTFYVVYNDMWVKAGIANSSKAHVRLARLRSAGLTEQRSLVAFRNGHEAKGLERRWLLFINMLPLEWRPSRHEVTSGWTEAVSNQPEVWRWVERYVDPLVNHSSS